MRTPFRTGTGPKLVGILMGSGLALGGVACVPPNPTMVVDQANVGPTHIVDVVNTSVCQETTWVSEVAQTFTAERTGLLGRVSLRVRPRTASSPPLSITVRLLRPDGAPGDVVVGAGQYSGAGAPPASDETVEADLGWPAPVLAGLRYALVLAGQPVDDCPVSETYIWDVVGTADTYSPGMLWTRGNLYNRPDWVPDDNGAADLVFRTWVTG